jgi:hypothetical protein
MVQLGLRVVVPLIKCGIDGKIFSAREPVCEFIRN